jgi:hypothetical protein
MDGDIDIAGHSISKSQRAGRATGCRSSRITASCQQREGDKKDSQGNVELSHDPFLVCTPQMCGGG